MIRIEETMVFNLPIETVFDAERDIGLHRKTQQGRGERAVDGVTSGLIEQGQEVEWEAVHFGIRQRLRIRIAAMAKPESFRVEMVRGAFKTMIHDHRFRRLDENRTEKLDVLLIEAPLGPFGWLAERLFLGAYMRRFLRQKNAALKAMIEPATAADGEEPGRLPMGRARIAVYTAGIWVLTALLLFFILGWIQGYAGLWILFLSLPGGLIQAASKAMTRKRSTWIFPLVPLALAAAFYLYQVYKLGPGMDPRLVLYMALLVAVQAGQAWLADRMVNRARDVLRKVPAGAPSQPAAAVRG